MMQLKDAAQMLGSAFTGVDAEVLRVSTDSRSIQPGDLFIALRGAKFDGGTYAAQALQQGAVAVVLDALQAPEISDAIRVEDTRLALGMLAAAWRDRFPIPVVAITGSNGKTTVKEMLAAILRASVLPIGGSSLNHPHPNPDETTNHSTKPASGQVAGYLPLAGEGANDTPKPIRPLPNPPPEGEGANAEPKPIDVVLATEGNFNNDIGLPLMLLRLNASHRYAVLEMGMNHLGEIDYLTRLTRPDVALVNNAQAAHVGLLGSVAEIARAKGEIFNGLSAQGVAIINADDAYAAQWREANVGRRVISFGIDQPAEIHGEFQAEGYGAHLTITTPESRIELTLPVPGKHNVRNALAATAAALAINITPAAIVAGLSAFGGVNGRLQRHAALNGSTFIDDSYNANPDSVLAALKVLAALPGKKILVLGDMGELGADAPTLHAQMGLAARQAGVDKLFALGELSREAVGAFGAGASHFERIQELLADLENELTPDTTVLVKGSRFMQMERVIKSFVTQELKGAH